MSWLRASALIFVLIMVYSTHGYEHHSTFKEHFELDWDIENVLDEAEPSYTLLLTNSGPVVVNSIITFTATVHNLYNDSTTDVETTLDPGISDPDGLEDPGYSFEDREDLSEMGFVMAMADDDCDNMTAPYMYTWSTDACKSSWAPASCNNITEASHLNQTVALTRVYSIYDVFVRDRAYSMNVVVYKRDELGRCVQIAKNTTKFYISERLNGALHIVQNMTRKDPVATDVFSTATNIMLNTTISDHFYKPNLTTLWHLYGPHGNQTFTSRNVSVRLHDRGRYVLFVVVTVEMTVTDQVGDRHLETRNTTFSRNLTLKDDVREILMSGSRVYKPGANFSAHVSCRGSPLFEMRLTLSDPDGVVIQTVSDTSESCLFYISQPWLKVVGMYTINVTIQNDVSTLHKLIYIAVHIPQAPGLPVVVPMAAVVIAILAVCAIIISYRLDINRGPQVESANFSFRYEDFGENEGSGIISRMVDWIKNIRWKSQRNNQRNDYSNNQTHVKMKVLDSSPYDAI